MLADRADTWEVGWANDWIWRMFALDFDSVQHFTDIELGQTAARCSRVSLPWGMRLKVVSCPATSNRKAVFTSSSWVIRPSGPSSVANVEGMSLPAPDGGYRLVP